MTIVAFGEELTPAVFGQQLDSLAGVRPSGAVADGVTDDHTALQTWLDSGGHLSLPAGEYYCSQTLIVRKHVVIDGDGYGFDARLVNGTATVGYELQPGSRIHFPAGVGGFDIQPQTTVTDVATAAAAGTGGYTQEGAMFSTLRNLVLVGAGTGASATGIYCRTTINLDNVHARKFQGKGFDISASGTSPDGNSEYGNASLSSLNNCSAIFCGSHGLHMRGTDANACTITNFNAQLNGGWGILDESFLGNTYNGGQLATNTLGSAKDISTTGNSQFTGVYAETGTGQAPDLSYRCSVIGGLLAEAADQLNAGTNGRPTITLSDGIRTYRITYNVAQLSPGAIAAKAVVYRGADRGLTLQGAPNVGGSSDFTVANKNDTAVIQIPTGTTTTRHFGEVWADFAAFVVNGDSVFPGLIATDGRMWTTATNGLMLAGFGSIYDTALANKNGTIALAVPTGTTDAEFKGNITAVPAASATPATNGQMTFELTNDTTLKIKVKGSDGTVRSVSLTLA